MSSAQIAKRMLVVEGYSDKRFFLGLQRHIGFAIPYEVKSPSDQNRHPGKVGAIKIFNLWLEEAAEPGRYESIGIAVDADFEPHGGFTETDEELKSKLSAAEFRMIDSSRRIYKHKISGCLASYWIAPSHSSDGYLESLLLKSLTAAEIAYLNDYVRPYCLGLASPRFESRNADRANLYTFLAIQNKPDKSLPTLLDDGLIDLSALDIADLKNWLVNLFGIPV